MTHPLRRHDLVHHATDTTVPLRHLDARGLADIGIDEGTRDHEIAKPFWQL